MAGTEILSTWPGPESLQDYDRDISHSLGGVFTTFSFYKLIFVLQIENKETRHNRDVVKTQENNFGKNKGNRYSYVQKEDESYQAAERAIFSHLILIVTAAFRQWHENRDSEK